MTRASALRLVVAPLPVPARAPAPAPLGEDRGWRPPRGRRRWTLAGLVLAGAGALARWLPPPDAASTVIAGAREVTAYEIAPGASIVFSLPPGATELRVLTNLDLPPGAPAEGVPYSVRVRVPEEARDDTFPLAAVPALDATGNGTAFFLGRRESPARTRTLYLTRASSLPATLEISLAGPALASLRVLVGRNLLGARAAPAPRPPTAGGLALDDLAPEARMAFEARSWSRLPAQARTATRGFYIVGEAPPAAALRPAGEAVGDGHVAAFTLLGPGTVHLEAPAGLSGEAALLERTGHTRVQPLALGPGGRASVAIGSGLTTVRVSARQPGRVRVIGEGRLAARTEERPTDPGEEVELGPVWSWQALSLAGPDGPAVEIAAGGRAEAGLRVSARLPLGSTPGPAPDGELRWRFVDGRGTVLREGRLSVAARTAPEDRLEGDGFVSVATVAFLWAPRGAERLLLVAPRPVAVSVASPALESPVAPADELGIDRSLVLRNRESTAYAPVHPLNQAELRRRGRVVRFAGALRLEAREVTPPASDQATSLAPEHGGAQFVLLAPLDDPPAADHREGLSFVVRPGRDETVLVARPRAASARARVVATLFYEGGRVRGRGSLAVSLDGQVVRRASLLGQRGQVALPPLPVGRHRLRVELPAGARAFIDHPVMGAAAYRRSRVFTLRAGGALVRLPKGAGARALGIVLYADGPAPRAALEAVVDGGARARRSGGASRDYTRLRRRMSLTFQALDGARYLNRAQPRVWASEPVFIPLGDDLRPGSHRIALRVAGLGAAPLARFFSYGGPVASRINQHLELRAEDEE